LRTAGELSLYAVLSGAAMLGIVAVLMRLEVAPLVVAAAALPLGAAAYAATLFYGRDRTFLSLVQLARAYAGLSTGRSSKVPPVRKID